CVNTGRPVTEVVTAGFPWCKPFTAQLAALFRAYTARKRARNLLDFDDLLLLWQAALADPAAGPVLRGMFDAVLVDEYQDVNAVRPCSPGLDLTLTGDRGQGMAPLLVRCHDEATQAREICARVLEAHEDGAALRDQAVLVRAAHHSDMLEIELSARKVPYVKF